MNRQITRVFKALSDPNRIRIIKMLEVRPLCVCEVRAVLNLSFSTVSKHLAILRDAGLIVDWKEGKWVNYRLNPQADSTLVRPLLHVLHHAFPDEERVRTDRNHARRINRKRLTGH